MLTDCAEDAFIAMCENAQALAFWMKRNWTVAYKKLACLTILVCLNYSTSLSNDNFSSFNNSTKEERPLRNEILSLKLRCHN